jgi:hypothetical protein
MNAGATSMPGRRRRVLVAEDEQNLRALLKLS